MTSRLDHAVAVQDWMVERRRELHRHPEVGIALPWTHDYLRDVLVDLGLPVEQHQAAGVTVRIDGHSPDGTVSVLRADMDALPVHERTGLDCASAVPGAMHACGHDLHMAMLLGAAKAMRQDPPRRDTVLAFQPGEESDRGALATLRHHNLQFRGPATAFAVHVHSLERAGSILHRSGAFMAFGDWFTVDVTGQGGHASQPHRTGNPIEAAAEFTLGLRGLVSGLATREATVATVTECRIGNTVNVIPAHGALRGTIRTLSSTNRSALIEGMRELASSTAEALGLSAELTIHEGYPAVMNDPAYVERFVSRLEATDIASRLQPMTTPSMVIEDFAYFLKRWPGAMLYLGAQVDGATSFNHSDDVSFDESCLAVGAALHLEAADGF